MIVGNALHHVELTDFGAHGEDAAAKIVKGSDVDNVAHVTDAGRPDSGDALPLDVDLLVLLSAGFVDHVDLRFGDIGAAQLIVHHQNPSVLRGRLD